MKIKKKIVFFGGVGGVGVSGRGRGRVGGGQG